MKVTYQLWHDRLGHLSFESLENMKAELAYHASLGSRPCHICPLAKQRRLPFLFI